MATKQLFGKITANIAGDWRYTTVIEVNYLPKTGTVEVTRSENGAVGGMDGPGGAEPFTILQKISIVKPTGKSIVKAIWMVMDTTVRTYGKPTKNFKFDTGGRYLTAVGISAAKAQAALDIAIDRCSRIDAA